MLLIFKALRRSSVPGTVASNAGHIASENAVPFQGTRAVKRSADTEAHVPATTPATKLHKHHYVYSHICSSLDLFIAPTPAESCLLEACHH